jgi:hypothetical protein
MLRHRSSPLRLRPPRAYASSITFSVSFASTSFFIYFFVRLVCSSNVGSAIASPFIIRPDTGSFHHPTGCFP